MTANRKYMKKSGIIYTLAILLLLLLGWAFSETYKKYSAKQDQLMTALLETPVQIEENSGLPVTFNLDIPFTTQSPFENWDELHDNTCEEAAIYMVNEFVNGNTEDTIDPTTAEKALLDLVEFQKKLFGFLILFHPMLIFSPRDWNICKVFLISN